MKVEFTSDYKLKIDRKGVMTEVFCPVINAACTTKCINVSEIFPDGESNSLAFMHCGYGGVQLYALNEDFVDNRPTI
jgi:hypothetical protein